jgi:hypothetical protein
LRRLSWPERISDTDGDYAKDDVAYEVAACDDNEDNVNAEEGGRAMTMTRQLINDQDDNVVAVGVCADVWGGIKERSIACFSGQGVYFCICFAD